MRGVTYVRRSTDRQEASLADQRSELKKLAETLAVDVIGEYEDDAVSGDDIERRLGFQRMIRDAAKGAFKAILAWDLDRFSRSDVIDSAVWIKPLRDAGVTLYTVAQGKVDWNDFSGRMMWSLQQEAKHQFLRDLSRNAVRGMRSAMESGVWIGPAPYGYRKKEKRLVIGPDAEVAAVRRVFALRLQGLGFRSIGMRMNSEGHPHPNGSWNTEFVRQILSREAYTGAMVIGRFAVGKYERCFPGLHRVEATHEPIVDRQTWLVASARKDPDRAPRCRRGEVVSPFGGMIYCGLCGKLMYARQQKGRRGYACSTYCRGLGCAFCFIEERPLLERIAEILESRVSAGEAVVVALIREKLGAVKAVRTDAAKAVRLTKKIERATQRLIMVPDDQVAAVSQQIAAWAAERDRLILEQATPQTTVSPEQVYALLRDIPSALRTAPPAQVRQVLSQWLSPPIVASVEREGEKGGRMYHRLESLEIRFVPQVPN